MVSSGVTPASLSHDIIVDIGVLLTIGAIMCGLGLVATSIVSLATAERRRRMSRQEQERLAHRYKILGFVLGAGVGLCLTGSASAHLVAGTERPLEAWTQVLLGLCLVAVYVLLYFGRKHYPTLFYKNHSPVLSARLDELDARLRYRTDIEKLLHVGHRIQAVKRYRDETGASLIEAKAGVDRMVRQIAGRETDL